MANKPFTFETELDDLPKEKLKGTVCLAVQWVGYDMLPALSPELIFHETVKFVSCCHEHEFTDWRGCWCLTPYGVPPPPLFTGSSIQYCVRRSYGNLKALEIKKPSLFCKSLHCIQACLYSIV